MKGVDIMRYKKFIYVATATSEYEASNITGVLFVNGITNYHLHHISGTTYEIIVTKETGRELEDTLDDIILCGFTDAKIK